MQNVPLHRNISTINNKYPTNSIAIRIVTAPCYEQHVALDMKEMNMYIEIEQKYNDILAIKHL